MPKYQALIAIDAGKQKVQPGAVIELPEEVATPLLAERAIEPAPGKAGAKPEGTQDPK